MRTRARVKSKTAPPARSVGDLLRQRGSLLDQVSRQAGRQQFWESWLQARLEPALYERISGITEQDGRLTVFAESAAWSARLRFVIAELEGPMRTAAATLTQISVRVLPRA